MLTDPLTGVGNRRYVMERLGEEERAAFLLSQVFDTPYADIARVLRRSEAGRRRVRLLGVGGSNLVPGAMTQLSLFGPAGPAGADANGADDEPH